MTTPRNSGHIKVSGLAGAIQHSLGGFTDYLTLMLDDEPMTTKTLREYAQQIGFPDELDPVAGDREVICETETW